jgi:Tol biopolymer transport system component
LSVDYNDDPWTTISGDGTLAGYTGGNYWTNDYIYDVTNQTTLILSTNGNRATTADLSGDGSYLIYDMVPWDTGVETVWSYNVSTGATIQMLAPDGSQPNNAGCQSAATNGNGELVLLICTATNLVTGVSSSANYLWDQFANTFTLLTRSTDGQEGVPTASDGIGAITSDGQYVAFSSPATDLVPGGTTGDQAFVYDTTTQATALVSSTSDGTAGDGSDAGVGGISADGRYVVFHYYGTNFGSCGGLPGVFVKDLQTGELQCVGGGVVGNISPDGQHVVFNSGGSGSQVYLATLQW